MTRRICGVGKDVLAHETGGGRGDGIIISDDMDEVRGPRFEIRLFNSLPIASTLKSLHLAITS